MATSDVRSIESLRWFRTAIGELEHNWDVSLQQIRSSMHRIQEHFSSTMPGYWKQRTRIAEQQLTEAMDNLTRQQGNSGEGRAPAISEAKQRVQKARRRLELCEAKQRKAANIAIHIERACQELLGPVAEVTGHVNTTLPNAALHLATLIGHLERYAEANAPAREPSATAVQSERSVPADTADPGPSTGSVPKTAGPFEAGSTAT